MPKTLPGEDRCTGCGACANACPTGALKLAENEDGFLMPLLDTSLCLSCGKCAAACPVFAPAAANLEAPAIYAFKASDETRLGSTSGGFFPVIAKKVLDQGGLVCGAVYTADWHVRHALAADWEGIQPMRGAKYMQSETGQIYSDLGQALSTGVQVLFTGTPCQVAGLRSFLGREYENLLTVDLVCEGVPPQKLFRRHLSEIDFPGPYKSVTFRSKHYLWGVHVLRIEAEDGRLYEGHQAEDNYLKGLLSGMTLRKACLDCPFCDYPRQGDLTMGDFWGCEQIINQPPDEMGTSMLFVNNAKGQTFFRQLLEQNCLVQPVRWSHRRIPNRVYRSARRHPGRNRLFDLLKTMSFASAIDYVEKRKFDAACIGGYQNFNFGGSLTYFALFNVLEDLGLRTLMVGPPSESKKALADIETYYEPGSWPEYVFAGDIVDKMAMRDINQRCNVFVTGSDQYFNTTCYQWTEGCVIQDWVEDTKKKVAYAASFGHDKLLDLPEEMREEMAFFIRKFDAFSVREDSGVSICATDFGVRATHVLDPVFLCDRSHYRHLASLASETNPENAKFVYVYLVDPTPEKETLVHELGAVTSLDYKFYTEWHNEATFSLKLSTGKFNKRLLDLLDSQFVVTDSFHGVTFSIIFKKPFIAFANMERGYTRFKSLLQETGLMRRMVHSLEEYRDRRDELMQPVDYDAVYRLLQPRIDFSMNWLKNALAAPMKKSLSDYDAAMRKMREVEKKLTARCASLEIALGERDRQLASLMHAHEDLLKRLDKQIQEPE